ncbi:MAG TPA: ABC transporter substrate-binding protein [Anaerolineae bacterium]|nr:ABC transporter substrate-binding protein [Anaerolineae bacterium]
MSKQRSFWSLLSAVLLVAFVAGCATPTPQIIEKTVEVEKVVEKTVEVEKQVEVEKIVEKTVEVEKIVEVTAVPSGPGVFNGAYPYQVPPVGHFNAFATYGIPQGIGIYRTLIQPSLAMYMWADGSWVPYLAENWEIDPTAATLTVNLRKGVKWSNGDDFNAQDVIATFNCRRLTKGTVWRFLESVTAKDDFTVVFKMSEPSTVVERYVVRNEYIVDRATYGEWSDKVQALVDDGKDNTSDEWNALLQEFNAFRPDNANATGPYTIDVASLNDARMTLVKNPTSYWADKVKFDIVYLYNGETPTVTPLVLAQQVDYATHGFPPATEKAFVASGVRIVRPPIYSGPALYFNHTIYPFNVKEVRQAIAYAVDRNQNDVVSLGESGKAVKYMAGFSDNMVPLCVDTGLLNTYDYNRDKATEILEGLGFTKNADGIWVTDKGDVMEYELTAPAEYADWSAAAENLAGQLTEFGIKVTFRGVEFNQHPIDVRKGEFELAIRDWGSGNPHPHFSFVVPLFNNNINAPEGPGISFDLKVTTDCCGEIDLEPLITDQTKGLDTEAQKGMVAQVAQAFNELLPVVPLWERYGNNPAMDGLHTCGWLPDSDPIYKNSPYADSFTVMMIMDGTLYPCNQ